MHEYNRPIMQYVKEYESPDNCFKIVGHFRGLKMDIILNLPQYKVDDWIIFIQANMWNVDGYSANLSAN